MPTTEHIPAPRSVRGHQVLDDSWLDQQVRSVVVVITRRRDYSPRGQCRDEGHVLAGGAELCAAPPGGAGRPKKCVGADVFAPRFEDVVFVVDCLLRGRRARRHAAVHTRTRRGGCTGCVRLRRCSRRAFFNACAVFDIHAGSAIHVGRWCAFLKLFAPCPRSAVVCYEAGRLQVNLPPVDLVPGRGHRSNPLVYRMTV